MCRFYLLLDGSLISKVRQKKTFFHQPPKFIQNFIHRKLSFLLNKVYCHPSITAFCIFFSLYVFICDHRSSITYHISLAETSPTCIVTNSQKNKNKHHQNL